MQSVLFLCTHNSARSQMAEGLLRKFHGNRYDVHSAGIFPTSVQPHAVQVMNEIGIDLSNHHAKGILDLAGRSFDLVVTVCDAAKESCPVFPGESEHVHKGFEDPSAFTGSKQESLAAYRRVRDEIREWLEADF